LKGKLIDVNPSTPQPGSYF